MAPTRAEISDKLQELVDEQLHSIDVRMFGVQLSFLDVANGVFISLDDDFSFEIIGWGSGFFDVNHQTRNQSNSSANFGLMQGKICKSIELTDTHFKIELEDTGSITLELGPKAFECFQVMFAGFKKNELEYMAVI